MTVNELIGQFRSVDWTKAKGPWTTGQRVHIEQVMNYYQCKVVNGFNIDGASVPFGFFVQIEPFNSSESILTIISAPSSADFDEAYIPVFNVRSTKVTNLNEYICAATITKQIVPPATAASSGENIWESTVTPIDDKHSELMVTTITSLNTVVVDEWDETLQVHVRQSKILTQTLAASSVVVAGTVTHTFYQEVRCNWWIQVIETFAAPSRSYKSNVEYYWPGVLGSITTIPFIRKDGGTEWYTYVKLAKEAYRGPCIATIDESFAATTAGVGDIKIMQPLPIHVETPFVSFSVEPTLHGLIDYNINISNDIIYEDVAGNYNYVATDPVDWPATIVASWTAQPLRGGFFIRKITVTQPAYT